MRLLLFSLGLGALAEVLPAKARLGFVPTAGLPYKDPSFVRDERDRLQHMGYQMTDVDFARETSVSLAKQLDQVDALFVAGGNTFFLMQAIRRRSLAGVLSDFISSDRLYLGSSAGAVICGPTLTPFEELDDLTAAPELSELSGLNWVPFTVLPHYGQPSYFKAHQLAMQKYAEGNEFIPLCDDEALWVTGPNIHEFRRSDLVIAS